MMKTGDLSLFFNDIKNEIDKEDDALLFTQLEQFRSNISTEGFPSLHEQTDDSSPLVFPTSEVTLGGLLDDRSRSPLMNSNVRNNEDLNIEKHHYIKYKLKDGQHIKIWTCGICSKEFGHNYTLMRHIPTHTDERKFQCNTCGKAFRQMSTLSQHRAIHSTERPYVCEFCHKTFNRVSTLISHRKTHTGLKPHRCHLCNKAFHQKGNLRNHIFTHTNERPYKCDFCDKGFNQKSNLMCHKLKAHQRTDEPKFSCRLCFQHFSKRISLRNHEQMRHGINQNQETRESSKHNSERKRYSNAIIVDPIKTEAMRLAIQSHQTPFALLRPLTGIPVLVRVVPAGNKQMLIPATAEDLKKHGQISIIPKVNTEESISAINLDSDANKSKPETVGSTVQIRIPVVATVIQQSGIEGLSMSIVSPGPYGEVVNKQECTSLDNNSFIYTSTLTHPEVPVLQEIIDLDKENIDSFGQVEMIENRIEFFDQSGKKIPVEEFRQNIDISDATNIYQNEPTAPGTLQQNEHSSTSEAGISIRSLDSLPSTENDTNQFLIPWSF